MTDNQIAALDCDWEQYPEAERAAFDAARRLTNQPYRFGAADWERLRKHYKDTQILEIVFTVGNNNATTRWTGGLGIPQDDDSSALIKAIGRTKKGDFHTLATPTAAEYSTKPSQLAPPSGRSRAGSPGRRPELETREQAEAAMAAAARREPRLALVDADKARALLPEGAAGKVPEWVRLLAHFPKAGAARVRGLRAAEDKGALSPLLRAQVAWIAARQDRAWYALGHAKKRLLALGLTEDDVYALDGSGDTRPGGERAALALARKLTSYPEEVTDADVEAVRKHYGDGEVAELVLHVCNAAFFDRVTEAANLRLEKW